MPARKKPWNADSSKTMFPELHNLQVEPPKPLAGTVTQGSSIAMDPPRAANEMQVQIEGEQFRWRIGEGPWSELQPCGATAIGGGVTISFPPGEKPQLKRRGADK